MLSIAVQHAVGGTARYKPAAGPRPRPRACGAGRAESPPAPVSRGVHRRAGTLGGKKILKTTLTALSQCQSRPSTDGSRQRGEREKREERERETKRDRERDRERQRETEKDRERQRETARDREREREREKKKHREGGYTIVLRIPTCAALPIPRRATANPPE